MTSAKIVIQASEATLGGQTIHHLNDRTFFPGKEGKGCARDALSAFWGAYAVRAQGGSEEEQSQAAERSIAALMRQLDRICLDFNKPLPHLATVAAREPMSPVAADPPAASNGQPAAKERSADGVRLSMDVKSVFASIL